MDFVKLTNFPTLVSFSKWVASTKALKNFARKSGASSPQRGLKIAVV